ncbi:shikimate kinase [[Clostridium] dakarense]|uniref:shikimate kinase n=1 Tax=Faecalimicrobium dakarense TaxID=1301100 RepID=UPI0004B88E4F|nr:shikimate kinase [[Clostridium] dakarense]
MRIILVGFMGSGKTVVGKKLSKKLKLKFVDMDEEIEIKSNSSVEKIFEEKGEEYFREKESNLLKELLSKENVVISTGGGIIKENKNCELLKKEKCVIFLDANEQTIINNVSYDLNKRPLLKDSYNLHETINNLLSQRYKRYNKIAKIKVNVNNKNVDEVVSQILVYTR